MPRPDAKIRRGPYGPQNLPDDIRQHGYVADLITVITQAADSMGQPIRIFRKNADWYIGVIIPNRAELAKIDAHTEAFSTRGESEAWITRRGPLAAMQGRRAGRSTRSTIGACRAVNAAGRWKSIQRSPVSIDSTARRCS